MNQLGIPINELEFGKLIGNGTYGEGKKQNIRKKNILDLFFPKIFSDFFFPKYFPIFFFQNIFRFFFQNIFRFSFLKIFRFFFFFSAVYMGTWRKNKIAIKKLKTGNLPETVLSEFQNETRIMTTFQFPQIVRLLGVVFEGSN